MAGSSTSNGIGFFDSATESPTAVSIYDGLRTGGGHHGRDGQRQSHGKTLKTLEQETFFSIYR